MTKASFFVSHGIAAGLIVLGTMQAAAAHKVKPGQAVAFDWFANAAAVPTDRSRQAQLIRQAYYYTDGRGSWVCSPAGSGNGSRCFRR